MGRRLAILFLSCPFEYYGRRICYRPFASFRVTGDEEFRVAGSEELGMAGRPRSHGRLV